MKKFFIFGAVAIVLSFAVALGVKAYNTTHNTLFYANLDALANPEDDNGGGGGTDPGEGGSNDKKTCYNTVGGSSNDQRPPLPNIIYCYTCQSIRCTYVENKSYCPLY